VEGGEGAGDSDALERCMAAVVFSGFRGVGAGVLRGVGGGEQGAVGNWRRRTRGRQVGRGEAGTWYTLECVREGGGGGGCRGQPTKI
jgi:hypothetical protein